MNTMNRRIEIINILIIRRHTTANELAQELGVSIRAIQYDIQALSPQYPIYTKPGENGGLFIGKITIRISIHLLRWSWKICVKCMSRRKGCIRRCCCRLSVSMDRIS